jgi:DNA-binding NarL/FixJ family response regulator
MPRGCLVAKSMKGRNWLFAVTNRRKRRGSVSHLRHVLDGTVVIAAAPERRLAGVSGREGYQRPRPRKLTIRERNAVRLEADKGRSLRSLAADFGVSHETVRSVIRNGMAAKPGV